jgi:hypothetical protein
MRRAGRVLLWLGAALGLLIAGLIAAFALLQTHSGQAWLARTVAQTKKTPG